MYGAIYATGSFLCLKAPLEGVSKFDVTCFNGMSFFQKSGF